MRALLHLVTCAVLLFCIVALPAKAEQKKFKGVCSKIVVQGNPKRVYEEIRQIRGSEQSIVKTIYENEKEDVLEESFTGLPIIGHATCRYKEIYTPNEEVSYSMIESDHFKAFEGRWVLTPMDQGRQTLVELSSYIDTGLSIPFSRQITNIATMKDVRARLAELKNKVESQEIHDTSGKTIASCKANTHKFASP